MSRVSHNQGPGSSVSRCMAPRAADALKVVGELPSADQRMESRLNLHKLPPGSLGPCEVVKNRRSHRDKPHAVLLGGGQEARCQNARLCRAEIRPDAAGIGLELRRPI